MFYTFLGLLAMIKKQWGCLILFFFLYYFFLFFLNSNNENMSG